MTTGTLTLADFLLARLAEDEAVAREASNWDEHLAFEVGGFSANARRFVDHVTPARVLAECEAKRRIIEQLETDPMEDPRWRGYHLGWRHAQSRTLALLAAPYADHPDYREDWR